MPQTHSSTLIKSVLQNSKVDYLVRLNLPTGCIDSSCQFNHKVLMVDELSQVNTIPAMYIGEDHVRASHGVAISTFSDQQLFYMESRGFSRDQSKKLLIESFIK